VSFVASRPHPFAAGTLGTKIAFPSGANHVHFDLWHCSSHCEGEAAWPYPV
jgi:hypothetical protein